MTENTTPQTETTEPTRCACAKYFAVVEEIQDEDGNLVDEITESTGCADTTKRTFAQGHDAKLKSALIQWGARDYEVAYIEGGLRIGTTALGVAAEYGFGSMVVDGIMKLRGILDARQARADAKHAKAAAASGQAQGPRVDLTKPDTELSIYAREAMGEYAMPSGQPGDEAEMIEPLPVPVQARVKIGRWTYEGTVNTDGSFTYNAKLGGTKTAPAGQFTVLDA